MAADEAFTPDSDGSAAEGSSAEEAGPSVLTRVLRMAGSDAAKYFPVRFVPALTSLATVPLFTRMIGTADYGNFYLVSSASTLAANVATGWISSSVIRFYWPSRREDRLDEYTATTVWMTFAALTGASALMALLVWLFRASLDPSLVRLVPVGLAYFVFNIVTNVLLQELRAANRAGAFSVLSMSTTILATALSIAFVASFRLGSFGILAGVALGNAVVLPLILTRIAEDGSISPRRAKRRMLTEYLHYGVPLIPVGMSSWILVLSDRFIIGWFRGETEVALYSVTYALGDKIMQLISVPLIMTMSPMIIQTFEHQGQRLAERVQTQFTRYFAMVCVPLLAGLAATAPWFMRVFTGPQYWASWPILAVVSAASILSGFAQIAGMGLGLHKRSRVIMRNTLVAAAFNVAGNVALVPVFGYRVAAYTTVAAYGVLLGLTWWSSRRYMRWQLPWAELGRISVASAVMAGAVLAVPLLRLGAPLTLALQFVTGIAVYSLALTAVRGLRHDEIGFARDLGRAGARKLGIGGRR